MSVRIARRGAIAASRAAAGGGGASTSGLTLPGTSGNYTSTPDSAAASVTGDIDIRIHATMPDWTPASTTYFIAKDETGTPSYSYALFLLTDGKLFARFSVTGTAALTMVSSVTAGITDGTDHWVRVTRAAATGQVIFYLSDDGASWSQLGTAQSGTSGNLADTTTALALGASSTGLSSIFNGTIHYVEVRSGIGGTVVAKFDPASDVDVAGTRDPSSFVSSTGETWTMTGSAWDWAAP